MNMLTQDVVLEADKAFVEVEYLALYPDVAAAVKAGAFQNGFEHFQKFGKAEGRQPNGIPARERAVFHLLNKKGQGLEVGPSHNPIAPKRNGFNVHILDHCNANELREKYKNLGLKLDNIEEVDFVWQGQSLPDLIGDKHCYDWIIASHVVEHIPNLISFMQQCEQLLKPDGVLSLVVPDKRYCFDCLKPLTTSGHLIDAYRQKLLRPTAGQVFDYYANSVQANGNVAWSADNNKGADSLIFSYEQAIANLHKAEQANEYIDVHCWHFIPESFALIIDDLNRLGLLKLRILAQFPTSGCEFYVSLGMEKTERNQLRNDRLACLKTIHSNNKYCDE